MRLRIDIALVLLVASASLAPAGAKKPPKDREAAVEKGDAATGKAGEARARRLTQALAAGHFGEVTKEFDERMAAGLPEPVLRTTWEQLVKQVGAFEKIDEVRTVEEKADHTSVVVGAVFAKAPLDLKWVFAGGRVSGFWIQPRSQQFDWSKPDYAHTERFQEREVTVGSGATAVPGTLSIPEDKGPFPSVILVHGSGPNDRDETVGANKPFKDLAWGLASRGIAVLRYEKQTRAHPERFSPDKPFTVEEEVIATARDAVSLLAARPDMDPKRIFIVGHSQGAWIAPRLAREEPRIAGIAVLAGNTRPVEDLAIEQLRHVGASADQIAAAEASARKIRDPKLRSEEEVEFLGSRSRGAYFLDVRGYHPEQVAAALAIPVFVAQGGRDYQVTMLDFAAWRRALDAIPRATLKAYPDLNHLFIAGSGVSTPDEYLKPGHVAAVVVDDLGRWIAAAGADTHKARN